MLRRLRTLAVGAGLILLSAGAVSIQPRPAAADAPLPPASPPYNNVSAFGDAPAPAPSFTSVNGVIVGMATVPDGQGYWEVASDGGIFTVGSAAFYGSAGGTRLMRPVVGMAATPTGHGYWLVAQDGGVFAFGDAGFYGSTGALRLARPVVGMAATPTGHGYWLVAQDGGVFGFGDAQFWGSGVTPGLAQRAVGMAATPTGEGYWLATRDGTVVAFGDATSHGDARSLQLVRPIAGIAPTSTGQGYWLVALDGGVFAFGDARYLGSSAGAYAPPNLVAVVGLSPTPTDRGYWLVGQDLISMQGVYFSGSGGGGSCADVVQVMRPLGRNGPLDLLNELLEGPTPAERASGVTSPFSIATARRVNSLDVSGPVARADFDNFSAIIPNASTSCGSAMLLAELDHTLLQPGWASTSTLFSFDGSTTAFYHWLQLDVPR